MGGLLNVILILSLVHLSTQDRVSPSAACSRRGSYYAQGCTGLTAELLGMPFKTAESYTLGRSIGSNGNYHGVSPGDIVGCPGHVAVYVGYTECQCMFVDVQRPGQNARCLSSYGGQTVYKAYY